MEIEKKENTANIIEKQGEVDPRIQEMRLCYKECLNKASLFLRKEENEQAIENFAQSVDLIEQLVQITDDEKDKEELFSDCETLAYLYKKAGNSVQAKRYFTKAVSAALSLGEKADRNELIECLCWLGSICMDENDLDKAEAYLQDARDIYEQMRRDISAQRAAFSSFFESLDNIEKAENDLMSENEIAERFDKVGDQLDIIYEIENLRHTAISLIRRFVALHREQEELGKITEYVGTGIKMVADLGEGETDAFIIDGVAVSNYYMARLFDESKSDEHYKKAYKIWSMLAKKNPTEPRYAKCRDMMKKHL